MIVGITTEKTERPLLTKPIFAIDEISRQYENYEQLKEALIKEDDIVDLRIKYNVKDKIKYTDFLYKRDLSVPLDINGLKLSFAEPDSFYSILLLPFHFLQYLRYITIRNLFISVKEKEEPSKPKHIKQKILKK